MSRTIATTIPLRLLPAPLSKLQAVPATPPTKHKSVVRSLSGAIKNVGTGDANVEKVELERVKVSEFEAKIEELQRKLQTMEGKVSSPPAHLQKRSGSLSQKSPAKEPPFKKGGVDVAAEPWKKIFQLAGECFLCLALTSADFS